ncbi:hypothetical protein F1559_001420 [Cyanidiococcus yangmingshanensis]|uniref:Helicase C-terminal domain-containing protein n=1 Tax=Cyanidiococcus yangmingshanensis TaxID=2690220 RepID=A0A7J7IFX8_9RHOD|nr:hypothetical protein F1559_001420 [Cyanidiococcus yangmingshanensis]
MEKAIAHELRRGGQVFYVVPRIADIPLAHDHVSSSLRKMKLDTEKYPILIGHGQSAQLEKIMLEFASGRGRILISTTIVENGLDIPTAGTIIVANAQRLGLAQLYQLRGRVGRRANLQAYCLFIFDPKSVVNNPDAQLRLQALRELTQERPATAWRSRSVGLQIAQRDLEIRGAGDLLGASQSGTNWDLGPELFARMLREVTEDLRHMQNLSAETGETKEQSLLRSFREYICNCEFALNGLIPSIPRSILPDPAERAQAYRNLSSMRSESEIDAEFEAILGGQPAPRALVHFSFMMKSRLYTRQLAIERIHSDGWDVLLQSPAPYRVWEVLLERMFSNSGGLSAPCKLSADRIYCRQSMETTQIVLRHIGKFTLEKQVELVLDFLRSCAKLCNGRSSCREVQRVPSGTSLSSPNK